MTDIDVVFCRHLLAQLKPALRAARVRMFRDGWVYGYGHDHWEFHGPHNFYWNGRAANAYDARFKGWSAWLEKFHPEQPKEDACLPTPHNPAPSA